MTNLSQCLAASSCLLYNRYNANQMRLAVSCTDPGSKIAAAPPQTGPAATKQALAGWLMLPPPIRITAAEAAGSLTEGWRDIPPPPRSTTAPRRRRARRRRLKVCGAQKQRASKKTRKRQETEHQSLQSATRSNKPEPQ